MGELSQRNGFMLLNVGCTEADGSFMETQSFGVRAVNLHVDGRELRDCLCIILQHFLERTFSAQIGRLSTFQVSQLSVSLEKRKFLVYMYKKFFFLFCHFLDPTASTSLLPPTVPPSSFIFKPEHDLVMF